jgi:hypothetical protein
VSDRPSEPSGNPPGAVDVVDGPIGSAWLRDPATIEPMGADRDPLEPIDGDHDESDDTRAIDRPSAANGAAPEVTERQDPDHVGVDWERTSRD